MTRNYFKVLFVFFVSGLLIGCATQRPQATFEALDISQAGNLVQKVDNFVVILDASSSMSGSCQGRNKLKFAKEIVSHMNETIPDLKLSGALRTFGQGYCPFHKRTRLIYGLTGYSKAGLQQAVDTVTWAGGKSPLAAAIDATSEDLQSAQGDIAVIIVSDGEDMDDAPVTAAEDMKNAYGDRLCIYTVLVGRGMGLMERIADAGRCGFFVTAGDIASSEGMAGFVEEVFFERTMDSDGDGVLDDADQCPNTPQGVKVDSRGCPLDSDGDGVYDYLDQCPNTPRGLKVDEKGCPIDTDGDGVYDDQDQCPGTPKGAKVNSNGCWVLEGIQFDTGKWNIKPESYPVLDAVVPVLEENPTLKLEVQGHTDNVGSQRSNQKLSENRAEAVMEHFVAKGIQPERLSSAGYGFSKPIASNDTPEGRAKNRRVQLKPVY